MSSSVRCSLGHDLASSRKVGPCIGPCGSEDVHREHFRKEASVPECTMSGIVDEDKENRLLDLSWRLQEVHGRVNGCFRSSFALNHCDAVTFDVDEYRKRSVHLLSHLPSFEEMQGMNQVPGMWSDLFQTELSMLPNLILLNRNIAIAKKMKQYVLTRDRALVSSNHKLISLPALVQVQASVLSPRHPKEVEGRCSVLNVVNQLVTFNEHIHVKCAEDRSYYDKLIDELDYIKESQLLNRSPMFEKQRGKVLPLLKRLSRMFDMDRCTLNLSMLFFDFYFDSVLRRENSESVIDNKRTLCIGTACYLLACALREHWTDISCDSYLDRAAQVVAGAFTSQDVVATQLDILQTMPKGFTSMYTATEYAIFFLSNVKGTYRPTCDSSGTLNGMLSTARSSQGSSTFGSDRGTVRTPLSPDTPDPLIFPQPRAAGGDGCNGAQAFVSREVVRSSPCITPGSNLGRTATATVDESEDQRHVASDELECSDAFCDYLLLEMGFKYMVENGGFAFVYQCVMRWDDSYISRNWNLFIPPSRVAAVLVFHFFVEFFGVDHRKDLVWCRRFCYKVFRMLYDCDVALWYRMFRDNIRKWVRNLAQSSTRLGEMALLLELSGQKFRAAATCMQTFWSRLLFDYVQQGYEVEGLDHVYLKKELDAIYGLISRA